MISPYVESKIVKLAEAESRVVVVRGQCGGENGEMLVKGYTVSVSPDK